MKLQSDHQWVQYKLMYEISLQFFRISTTRSPGHIIKFFNKSHPLL